MAMAWKGNEWMQFLDHATYFFLLQIKKGNSTKEKPKKGVNIKGGK